MRLYGTLYDGSALKSVIGAEIEHFDLLEIKELMENLSAGDIAAGADHINKEWDFVKAPREGTVENSVKVALAFMEKIKERSYDAFSFCDVDGVKKLLKFAPAGAMTLLHDKMDIPTVPENDSYGAVTQLIVKYLTGKSPAYLEFYEFTEKSALMGVPDYVPSSIVDGKVTVMPNAFGSFGEGLLNVSKLKTGMVTIARLTSADGIFTIHTALGTAKTPEKWEEAGWTPPAPQLPSLEVFPDSCTVEEFAQNVSSQHVIVAYGNHVQALRDFCAMMDIELVM